MRSHVRCRAATLAMLLLGLSICPGSIAEASQRSNLQQPPMQMPCRHHQAAPHAASSVRPARKLLQKRYAVSPDPDNKGCYLYRCNGADTIEDIARALSVSAADLKSRNEKNIADFSRLNGRFLQICDIGNFANVEGANGAATPRLSASAPTPPPPPPEPAPAPKPKPEPAPEPAPAPAPKAEPAPAPAETKSETKPAETKPAETKSDTTETKATTSNGNGQTTTTTTTTQQPQQQQVVLQQQPGIMGSLLGIGRPTVVTTNGGQVATTGTVVRPVGIGFGGIGFGRRLQRCEH